MTTTEYNKIHSLLDDGQEDANKYLAPQSRRSKATGRRLKKWLLKIKAQTELVIDYLDKQGV